MNYAQYVYIPPQPDRGFQAMPNRTSAKTVPLRKLHECARQDLPLDLHVTSATKEEDFVLYNVTTSSMTTTSSWGVSYRYSQFDEFSTKVQQHLTCHNAKCYGSCQAIRDYLMVSFPKKRLGILSSSAHGIADRKAKFEHVLLHLLRCVLVPGSSMKCFYARQHLPNELFRFLGVEDTVDQRSILQVFTDNHQLKLSQRSLESGKWGSVDSDAATVDSVLSEQCTICLYDVELDICESACTTEGTAARVLPCSHTFHRECVFELLLFEPHCPVCRARVGPPAVTKYCRIKKEVQWWLGDFEEDPLCFSSKEAA